tara:strand:- start:29 stop:466 length:438 start_codon:yes stop_codon:yes gene_type:complete
MIYVRNISLNDEILLILKELLNHNIYICKIILKQKKTIENNENRIYYLERYQKIAKEHYCLHNNHTDKFSYVLNSKNYIIKTDFKLDYYKYTGISYQIIELIHELIKLKNDKYIKDQEYKSWLDYDDKLYSILSEKITNQMNSIS